MSGARVRLGSLGKFIRGKGISKADLIIDGDIPCIRYAELYTTYGEVIKNPVSRIAKEAKDGCLKLEFGDIIFPTSGETSEEIGKAAAFLDDQETYIGGDTVILRGHGQDPVFLAHALNSWEVNRQKFCLSTGTSVVHIYASELSKISFWLPSLAEQQKIAKILLDCDRAIGQVKVAIGKKQIEYQGLCQRIFATANETQPLTDIANVSFSNVDKKKYEGQTQFVSVIIWTYFAMSLYRKKLISWSQRHLALKRKNLLSKKMM